MKKTEKKVSSRAELKVTDLRQTFGQESKVIQVSLANIDTALNLGPR